jgi:hypothetical protein
MPHQSREEFSLAAANHLRASNGWRKLDPDLGLIPPLRSNTLAIALMRGCLQRPSCMTAGSSSGIQLIIHRLCSSSGPTSIGSKAVLISVNEDVST